MEYEYDLKNFADKRNGVKLYKSLIVNFASVAEFVNINTILLILL